MSGEPFSSPRGPSADASGTGSSTSTWSLLNRRPYKCVIRGCPSQFGAGGESAPHRLSCGDVVCSGCWSAARAVGNCPACGFVEVKLEFVDEALAFVGKTRLEAESGPASPTPACADCNALGDSDVPATHLCGCGDGKPLCVDHVLVHSRKRHELIPVDPVAAVGQFCVKHPEERVTMFCMDDGEAMCTICATVSHRGVGRKAGKSKQPPPPHCGHNVVELKEARSLLMPELSSALKSLGSDCGRVSDLAAAVTEARDALRASSASSEAKTHTAFEALHAIIDAHKVRVLGSLRKATSAREQSLSTQLMRLEACLSQMCDGLTLGSFALEHCNPSLMSSTLTSLAVVSRLLQRESLGPCDDGFVALDVNLAGVVDAFQYASALRQSRADPTVLPETLSGALEKRAKLEASLMNAMQDKEALERQVLEAGQVLAARGHELQQEVKTLLESSEKKTADIRVQKEELNKLKADMETLRAELAAAKQGSAAFLKQLQDERRDRAAEKASNCARITKQKADLRAFKCALQLAMVPAEDAILAKCKSIGIAGSAAELSELDINLLTLFGRYCSASSEKAGVGFCEAVAGACFAVSNRELLGQPGIDAVISAMKSHKSSVKVQSSGCRALWNLTCCNEGNKRLSVAAGAVHCIKAAWNAVAGHTDAVYNAIGALALVTTAESVEAILFPGCLNGILSFMEVHQANSDVQFVCSMAISSFAGYPVGRAALKADDRTSYYLQRARVTHKTHATVQQYSKSALELLGLL